MSSDHATERADWEQASSLRDRLPDGWRRHARRAHRDLAIEWGAGTGGVWLKTDLNEERDPRRGLLPELPGTWVGIDIASGVVGPARAITGVAGCVADVRLLPFAAESFAGALSTSTLDHFATTSEIERSLRELRRVMKQGATLVLTLDNFAHPLVRLRNALPRRAQRVTGLVPFTVGATLDARQGRAMLERCGFDVARISHVLHAPHVVGTRLARYRWFETRALPWFDRLGTTRFARRTGHFVAFRCVAR